MAKMDLREGRGVLYNINLIIKIVIEEGKAVRYDAVHARGINLAI